MGHRQALVRVVAVVAVLVGPVPLAAAAAAPARLVAAAGSIGIQLLDAPVSAKKDPRAHTYIVDQLAPGTTITRHVRVVNSTATVANIALYSAAASISGGQFHFGDGRASNDLTSWTTVTPRASALAAGASVDATVRIAVPSDANGGEQYAVIWAQVASAQQSGAAVREINRVGVRVYLEVSSARRASTFTITRIAAGHDEHGKSRITASVTNTGQRALDIGGTVGLSRGPGGLSSPAVAIDSIVTIAPGGREPVSAVFDARLPPGPWLVTVALESGLVHNRAAATVTFPVAGSVRGAVSVRHPQHQTWLPWLIGLVVALALLAVVAWLLLRPRSRHELIEAN